MGERDQVPQVDVVAVAHAIGDVMRDAVRDGVAEAIRETSGIYVRKDVYDERMKAIEAEQKRLGGSISWASRTAIAAVVCPLIAAAVTLLLINRP